MLRVLERAGEIRQTVRSNGGRNSRNRYLITVVENPDKITLSELQGKNNPVICDTKTLSPASGAINRHRTVNKSGASRKEREHAATDPRINTLLTAFVDKYLARVGTPYVVVKGKDHALLKRLLTGGHDLPAIDAAMDRYFADAFYSKTGFDVGGFAKSYNRLNSAGARKKHDYDKDAFPSL